MLDKILRTLKAKGRAYEASLKSDQKKRVRSDQKTTQKSDQKRTGRSDQKSGLSKRCRGMGQLIDFLANFPGASREKINEVMLGVIAGDSSEAKKLAKITNVLTYLRKKGLIAEGWLSGGIGLAVNARMAALVRPMIATICE